MNVTFKHQGEHLASARYRSIIPARELGKLGVGNGNDWLILGKHNWKWEEQVKGFHSVCFDVCDDHFSGAWAEHYTINALRADMVTTNSDELARIIWEKVGRTAVVIPDPWEQPEEPAKIHDKSILWFGHPTNLVDISPYVGKIRNLDIISGTSGFTPWTPENMHAAFWKAGLVVIPTGKSMAKSGNRAIESIRRGLFVVHGYLPAYGDLGMYCGNIEDGIKWALTHQEQVLSRVKLAQEYVKHQYSPQRIGSMWLEALSSST